MQHQPLERVGLAQRGEGRVALGTGHLVVDHRYLLLAEARRNVDLQHAQDARAVAEQQHLLPLLAQQRQKAVQQLELATGRGVDGAQAQGRVVLQLRQLRVAEHLHQVLAQRAQLRVPLRGLARRLGVDEQREGADEQLLVRRKLLGRGGHAQRDGHPRHGATLRRRRRARACQAVGLQQLRQHLHLLLLLPRLKAVGDVLGGLEG
mmetsp:Transcript_38911/g.99498  ORF Transcript_38911/g.99498 Transcript_38911/m.99498 type:complete len:206 (-) Transcript_38911:2863-3480(-)